MTVPAEVPAGTGEAPPVCSAKACRAPAEYVLSWRNPRIHGLERRKAWAACAGHRDSLAEFLSARSFLLDVAAVAR